MQSVAAFVGTVSLMSGLSMVEYASGAPRVSVFIPCHNYAAYVGQAIESVLAQSLAGPDLEVIVVDDASTDASWAVIEKYFAQGVIGIRHERNQGHIRTYHDGMERSRGEYIVLLSADDLAIDRDALRDQARLLDDHPEAGIAYADFVVIDEAGRKLAERAISAPQVMRGAQGFRRLLFDNFVQHSGTMVRRAFFVETGGYDERLFHSVDWELWLRVAARADLAHVDRPLYAYRVHAANMHSTLGYAKSMAEVMRVLEIASAYGPPDARGLLSRAFAHHHVMRAAVYLRLREYESAVRDIAAAIRRDPRAAIDVELARGLVRGFLGSAWRR